MANIVSTDKGYKVIAIGGREMLELGIEGKNLTITANVLPGGAQYVKIERKNGNG